MQAAAQLAHAMAGRGLQRPSLGVVLFGMVAAGATAGCVSHGPAYPALPVDPHVSGTRCDASKARFAIGQRFTEALLADAVVKSGALIGRPLHAGSPYTLEHLPDRLSVELSKTGIVAAVSCG